MLKLSLSSTEWSISNDSLVFKINDENIIWQDGNSGNITYEGHLVDENPNIEIVADPLLSPWHKTLLTILVENNESGCETFTLSKNVQLFVSLIK